MKNKPIDWVLGIKFSHQFLSLALQIRFIGTIVACRCATSRSCAHQAHMGMPIGVLWMPELRNHQADSLQIKTGCNKPDSWNLAGALSMAIFNSD